MYQVTRDAPPSDRRPRARRDRRNSNTRSRGSSPCDGNTRGRGGQRGQDGTEVLRQVQAFDDEPHAFEPSLEPSPEPPYQPPHLRTSEPPNHRRVRAPFTLSCEVAREVRNPYWSSFLDSLTAHPAQWRPDVAHPLRPGGLPLLSVNQGLPRVRATVRRKNPRVARSDTQLRPGANARAFCFLWPFWS